MNSKGQLLAGAIVILMILAITVPAIISYIQNESKWTVKQTRSTRAVQLAESAVERGYMQLIISTSTLSNALAGTPITGYAFDQIYSDTSGGSYAILIGSHSSSAVSVTGVDRDGVEVRAIRAIYSSGGTLSNAITATGAINIGAAVQVQWGPVVSYTSIATGGRNYPRYFSTGNITPQDGNAASTPNTDNTQWWSYLTTLSQPPDLDFTFYKSSAIASGNSPDAQCGSYYKSVGAGSTFQFRGCTDTTGRTFYIEGGGDVEFAPGAGGNFVRGNIIVTSGDISFQGNGGGSGSYSATIPPTAWQEYCKDATTWTTYRGFDPTAPATCAAATASSYQAIGKTHGLSSVVVRGLLYAGDDMYFSGGGNGTIHGVVRINDAAVATSNFEYFYDDGVAASVRTVTTSMARASWEEVNCSWSGTYPSSCQ